MVRIFTLEDLTLVNKEIESYARDDISPDSLENLINKISEWSLTQNLKFKQIFYADDIGVYFIFDIINEDE